MEELINKLENKSTNLLKVTHTKNSEIFKKRKRSSKTCEIISSHLMYQYMYLEPQKEKKERTGRTNI